MADLREIPSIDELRRRPAIRELEARFGGSATVEALRAATADVRRTIASGDGTRAAGSAIAEQIERGAASHLGQVFSRSLEAVVNATGVVVHTNLGRAPLAYAAIDRIADIARGYSSVEYDLERGARGRRDAHAEPLLCRLTGAESAVVVNNNAAAMLLVLAALASGREVIVSRGELVEIGGGFRIPDVMQQSGATLREVGTTNKTRAADYAAAVTDRTALILRVHQSNFRIEGFTERPALYELVALGRRLNVPVAEDLGSGYLGGMAIAWTEPSVAASIGAGVDVCCFSGDKLLGGPQAGIIVGKTVHVDRVRRHPLVRALRVDKITYAALEATLGEYAAGRAQTTVPVQRMLAITADEIRARAEWVAGALERVGGVTADLVSGVSAVGGGAAPGVELPTWLVSVAVRGLTPDGLEEHLRRGTPPVIARIERDQVLLDLRTVLPEQDQQLTEAFAAVRPPEP